MRMPRLVRNLIIVAVGVSLLGGSATAANAAPAARYVTKTVTVKYTAQDQLNYWAQYDSQGRNSCARAPHGVWKCVTHDAKKNPIGGYSTCMMSDQIPLPAKVMAAVQRHSQLISLRAKFTVSKLRGGVYWKGYPALPHAILKKAGTMTIGWAPLYPDGSWTQDLCLKPNTSASLKSMVVSYRYKVRA
jgi:hypothetical protein